MGVGCSNKTLLTKTSSGPDWTHGPKFTNPWSRTIWSCLLILQMEKPEIPVQAHKLVSGGTGLWPGQANSRTFKLSSQFEGPGIWPHIFLLFTPKYSQMLYICFYHLQIRTFHINIILLFIYLIPLKKLLFICFSKCFPHLLDKCWYFNIWLFTVI